MEAGYEAEGEEVPAAESVEVVESGPLRAAVRVERRFRGSWISQTYVLLSGSRRLDIETRVRWHERQVLLRALFPLRVRSHEATFETMYGVVKRPTHRNTSWDGARFEVCAHRFADLSEPGYGVALLNDGKYGHSARDNVLGISLLRGPLYPDPLADEGEHRFTYSLFPAPGRLDRGRGSRGGPRPQQPAHRRRRQGGAGRVRAPRRPRASSSRSGRSSRPRTGGVRSCASTSRTAPAGNAPSALPVRSRKRATRQPSRRARG